MKVDSAAGFLRDHPEGCSLAVRVQPGATQSAVLGIYGEAGESRLKIALKAQPIEGRANEALIVFLAELMDLPRSAVSVAAGLTSRSKLVILKTAKAADVRMKVQTLLGA